jgi:hypothetical protein
VVDDLHAGAGEGVRDRVVQVGGRADLDEAVRTFDERGIEHGEVVDLAPFGIFVLSFRDPDGLQLELSAPSG